MLNHVNVVLLWEDAVGCKLVVSHTELEGFVGRSQHHPCLWEVLCCDCWCGVLQHPPSVGQCPGELG